MSPPPPRPQPQPAPRVAGVTPYRVPSHPAPLHLDLRGNEGDLPDPSLWAECTGDVERLRRYPDARSLEAALAARVGASASQVLVTAGGDDALDRLCRAVLAEGREAILPAPGFEMTERYACLAGGAVVEVPWPGERFPTDAVLAAVTDATALIVVTTPNNPTGAVATAEDLARLSAGAPHAVLLVDLAYTEFAEEDLTPFAMSLPNAVLVRTFSKAWGLAGVRVGYAIGPRPILDWMRAAGAPYAVAGPSIALATAALARGDARVRAFSAEVRTARLALEAALAGAGAEVVRGQANFAFARVRDPLWVRDALAGLGIGVRHFPGRPGLEDAVRVGIPPRLEDAGAVAHGLATALAPAALLFDMDGVMADVSGSYRAAILGAAAAFGVALSPAEVAEAKRAGDANNDWVLTQRLLAARGVTVALPAVTEAFEALYQGGPGQPGLRETERLLGGADFYRRLAARLPLAVVTGRPRRDAHHFLDLHGIADCFSAVVCMEDGPPKPAPDPVRAALRQLGVTRAWMFGDTVDDVRAARAAGVVPLGVLPPGDPDPSLPAALFAAGAARVLDGVAAVQGLLP